MFVAIPRSLQSFYTVIEAATIKYFIIFGLFNQNFYSRSVEDSIVELGLVEFQYIHYLLLYVSHFFLCLKISWTFQTAAFALSLVYLDYFVRIWWTMFLYKSLLMLLYFLFRLQANLKQLIRLRSHSRLICWMENGSFYILRLNQFCKRRFSGTLFTLLKSNLDTVWDQS